MHLGFRLTVMPLAAEKLQRVGAAPDWYEPWRNWAGLGFGIYHVLAYLALMLYGIALLKTRILPRAAGWLGHLTATARPHSIRCIIALGPRSAPNPSEGDKRCGCC